MRDMIKGLLCTWGKPLAIFCKLQQPSQSTCFIDQVGRRRGDGKERRVERGSGYIIIISLSVLVNPFMFHLCITPFSYMYIHMYAQVSQGTRVFAWNGQGQEYGSYSVMGDVGACGGRMAGLVLDCDGMLKYEEF